MTGIYRGLTSIAPRRGKVTFQQMAASDRLSGQISMVWVRATFVGLLTALLLSYSCASAACEIQCASNAAAPGCHGHASRAHSDPPADMAGMPDSTHHSMTDEVETLSLAPSCQHRICATDFLFFGRPTFEKTPTTEVTRSGILHDARCLPPSEAMWLSVRGSPPLPPSSQIALRTTLRV